MTALVTRRRPPVRRRTAGANRRRAIRIHLRGRFFCGLPRLHHGPDAEGRRCWPHGSAVRGKAPRRRRLAGAPVGRAVDEAGRSRRRRLGGREATAVLEPCPLSAERRPADAVLQSRSKPAGLAWDAVHQRRRRRDVVAASGAAGRLPWADQEQAGPTGRWRHSLPQQHGGRRLARPLRAHRRPGPRLVENGPPQRRQGNRRHPADDPVPRGRPAAGARPQPSGPHLAGLVEGRGQDVGRDGTHGPAEPQFRHRRRDAGRRPATARLQPHDEGPQPAQRRRLGGRQSVEVRRSFWNRSRGSTRTRRSCRTAKAWSTSPTPGSANGSNTW